MRACAHAACGCLGVHPSQVLLGSGSHHCRKHLQKRCSAAFSGNGTVAFDNESMSAALASSHLKLSEEGIGRSGAAENGCRSTCSEQLQTQEQESADASQNASAPTEEAALCANHLQLPNERFGSIASGTLAAGDGSHFGVVCSRLGAPSSRLFIDKDLENIFRRPSVSARALLIASTSSIVFLEPCPTSARRERRRLSIMPCRIGFIRRPISSCSSSNTTTEEFNHDCRLSLA
eukprot:2181639-Rhodomonas_salina.2